MTLQSQCDVSWLCVLLQNTLNSHKSLVSVSPRRHHSKPLSPHSYGDLIHLIDVWSSDQWRVRVAQSVHKILQSRDQWKDPTKSPIKRKTFQESRQCVNEQLNPHISSAAELWGCAADSLSSWCRHVVHNRGAFTPPALHKLVLRLSLIQRYRLRGARVGLEFTKK